MPNKAPSEMHTNVMRDSAIAFIYSPLPAMRQPLRVPLSQPSNRINRGREFKSLHAFAECILGRQLIAARQRLATFALFRLGGGGNCRFLCQQCSPIVDQALEPVGCHIQCCVIHRAFVATS